MITSPHDFLISVPVLKVSDFSQELFRRLHFTFSQLSLSFHAFVGLLEVVCFRS